MIPGPLSYRDFRETGPRSRLLDMIYVSKDQHQRTNNEVQFNFFLLRPNSVYNQLTGENDILAIR